MAINFYVDIYNKRENSTLRPSTATMVQMQGNLKQDCSVLNPVIIVNTGDAGISPGTVADYNYAYIPSFNRRYWIRDWVYVRGLWECYLEVDVLATYKDEIGSASLYVLRSSDSYNGDIMDTLYPVKSGCDYSYVDKSTPWRGVDNGFFVVGIVSKRGGYGSIEYYAMTASNMNTFLTRLMSTSVTTTNGFNWDDASQALQKAIVDPIQYIKSAVFIPRPLSDISGTSVTTIDIFDWDITGIIAKIPNVTEDYITFGYSIPKHPDTNARGNYVNASPYTIATIAIPPFGVIEIDTSVTCNTSTLQVDIHLDIHTGRAVLEIMANGEILNSIEAQVGVPIQISQVAKNYLGAASSILGSISSALGRDFVGSLNGIGNAYTSLVPRANTIGSQGSFTALSSTLPFRLTMQFFRPVADDLAHNGRPLCAMRTPSNLGGYMLIQDGDVAINGTLEEARKIRDYLEGGFYYE